MNDLESLVKDALRAPDDGVPPPSPDLFERVMGSVGDDRLRRRHLARVALAWGLGLAVVASAVLLLLPRNRNGVPTMHWAVLEVATNLALVAIAVWLGPFIKRFGRAYAADVFHDNPLTGKSYIVLTDIVYYLIFAAYILLTVRVEHEPSFVWWVQAQDVTWSLQRIGGILLIIGVLHGLNLLIMPVLGRLFSLNRRLPERSRGD